MAQTIQYGLRVGPEIDQAGDLVHADRAQALHGRFGIGNRAEEPSLMEVGVEGPGNDELDVLFLQIVDVEIAIGLPERPGDEMEELLR